MKKLTFFTSIFVCVLILLGFVRMFSADKIKAKKSISLILSDFKSGENTKVRVLEYQDANCIREVKIEDNKVFLRLFRTIMEKYVVSRDSLDQNLITPTHFARVELVTKDSTCMVDFPLEYRPYESAIIRYQGRPDGGIFNLTKKGRGKIKFLLGE